MKTISFLFLIHFMVFAQQNSVEQKLETLFSKADLFFIEYKSNNNSLTLNKCEANDITKLLYELYSFHWIDVYNYIDKKYNEAQKLFKESAGKNLITPSSVKLRILKESIDSIMGNNFSEIIITPYFLKVKILDINLDGVYHSDDNIFGKTTILCKILEVVKGNHLFKTGENIEISLLTGWGIGPFEKGATYFFPVKPWNCKNGNCSEYSLNLYSKSDGFYAGEYDIYPVRNEQVLNIEYFKISSSNWSDFVRKFKEKYLLEEIK